MAVILEMTCSTLSERRFANVFEESPRVSLQMRHAEQIRCLAHLGLCSERERESFEVALRLPVGMIVFASACSINCFDLFLF